MAVCELCPRRCGADRENGIKGFCGETSEIRVARAALHMWEEPCISGKVGSGAVFFTEKMVPERFFLPAARSGVCSARTTSFPMERWERSYL